jgi:CDP-diacylglycerol--glycerol-3-phosphate 3-phosphatidyltransferase
LPFLPSVILDVAMWLLAAASVVTVGQRVRSVLTSPDALAKLPQAPAADEGETH